MIKDQINELLQMNLKLMKDSQKYTQRVIDSYESHKDDNYFQNIENIWELIEKNNLKIQELKG